MFFVTGANRHDSVFFEALVDAMPAMGGKPGRTRRWPGKLNADTGYDFARLPRSYRATRGRGPYRPQRQRAQRPTRAASVGG